jgi:hypothetical protein
VSVFSGRDHYDTLLIGNDPVIQGLENFKATKEKRMALIGTSGLRSVLLACELSDHSKESFNHKNFPKIFIIDNSATVHDDWKRLQKIAARSDNENVFLELLCEQRNKQGLEASDGSFEAERFHRHQKIFYYDPNNVKQFCIDLFNRFGYQNVRRIIMDVTLIKQTWQDEKTFHVIKNRLEVMKIKDVYTYPSNIGLAPDTGSCAELMKNIAYLNAKLSIHTNFTADTGLPERFYLIPHPKSNFDLKELFKDLSIDDVLRHDNEVKVGNKILSTHQKIKPVK